MRAIWTGAISFGLISIPVKLYKAVSQHGVDFDLLDAKNGSRIRYKRVSEKTGREVDWDDIVKGYEYEDGKYVTFTKEELANLDLDSIRAIDIVEFVDRDEIDPLLYDQGYYLAPSDESGVKAYKLLVHALESQNRVGIAKVALRQKEHLAALLVRDGMFVLETLNWPEEVRPAEFDILDRDVRLSAREKEMAEDLVEQLATDFDPGRFKDEYEQKLCSLIKRKIDGEDVTIAPRDEPQAQVVDLMAALEASLKDARKGGSKARGRSGDASANGNGNRENKGKGKRKPFERMSKGELYELAQQRDIPGRSDMDKEELVDALKEA